MDLLQNVVVGTMTINGQTATVVVPAEDFVPPTGGPYPSEKTKKKGEMCPPR